MKFFVVLKDSYREAIDGKIFQAMLVLSGLFILFVFSISYKPIMLKEAIENDFAGANFLGSFSDAAPKFTVENARVTNGATEAWKADQELEFVVTCSAKEVLDQFRKNPQMPTNVATLRTIIEHRYPFFKTVTVEEMPQTNPAQVRFRIATQGATVTDPLAWPHEPTVLFAIPVPIATDPLRTLIYRVEKWLVGEVGARLVLFIGIVITAGFVPNLLRKGTLDLYIVKPIGRSELLTYKFVGGLLFVFLLTAFTVLGVWAAIGLRTGIWAPQFLVLIPILTLYFAILYAVSVFVGVFTRSMLVAILLAFLAWGFLFLAGFLNDKIRIAREAQAQLQKAIAPGQPIDTHPPSAFGLPAWAETTIHTVCNILPRGYDLDKQAARAIARGVLTEEEIKKEQLDDPLPPWAETIGVSLGWIALLLALACWRFQTRDG